MEKTGKWDPFLRGGGKLGDPKRGKRSEVEQLEREWAKTQRLSEFDNNDLRALLFYRERFPEYLDLLLSYVYDNQCTFVEAQMALDPPSATEEQTNIVDKPKTPVWLTQAILYGHFD